jgi:hypothetical protein
MKPTIEEVAEEMLKVHSEEELNMLAEHFPKCFAHEVKIAKRFIEPKSNTVIIANP